MQTLGDLIEHNARYFSRTEAFVCGSRRLTHGDFAIRSRKLADAFYRAGLRRGDRIAVVATNCQETWDVFGGAELGGFVAVPINFRLASAETAYILSDIQPAAVVFEPEQQHLVQDYRASHPDLVWIGIGGPSGVTGTAPLEEFLSRGDIGGPPIRAEPGDLAYVFYTSGTTGRPKGAMIGQRGALAGAEITAAETEMLKGGTWLVHSPQFHTGANGPRLAQQLRGGRIILHRTFSPAAALKDIEAERINGTMTVGTMLQAVLDIAGEYDLSSMQAWMVAGAPASPDLMRRAIERLGRIFVIQYGMTEGRVSGLYRHEIDPDAGAEAARRLRSVGRPSPHIDVEVRDEAGGICPANVPGEVTFRSPNLFLGYWNNSAATVEALRDGWMRSGDVGYFDEDNYLYLVDRKKDMIISGGENIYSREVEDAIAEHAEVTEVAVVGVPDPKWGEAVQAFVVPVAGTDPSEAAIIEHCRALIARYKCPKRVVFLEALPRVANGKIDKPALRSAVRSVVAEEPGPAAVTADLEGTGS